MRGRRIRWCAWPRPVAVLFAALLPWRAVREIRDLARYWMVTVDMFNEQAAQLRDLEAWLGITRE